jgi:Contractile injection system tube protein
VSGLVQATLQRLKVTQVGPPKKATAKATPVGKPLPVQFNPATLRISRRNNVDRAGTTTQSQKAQNPSAERATLAFDLEFDTAEQDSSGRYVDVRQWTALVRQFVEPPPDKPGEAAPAVQFAWGTVVFNGIIDQITEELDYFAPDGTPLHAKVSVSISEQDFKLDGAAARTVATAAEPGQGVGGTGPGETPTGPLDQVAQARNNESAQQLMTRLGLDPGAWRAAMSGIDSPLDLAPGLQVPISASATRAGSIGLSLQFAADAGGTTPDVLARALGIPPARGQTPTGSEAGGTLSARADGFALAAAGGLDAATQTVSGARAAADATAARSGFDVPPGAGPPARPPGVPLSGREPTDPRVLSYGSAVPLQSRARPRPAQPGASAPWETLGVDDQGRQRTGDGRRRWWTPGGACR